MAPASDLPTLAHFGLRQTSPLGFPPRDILDAYVDLNGAEIGTPFVLGRDQAGNTTFFVTSSLGPVTEYRHTSGKIEEVWISDPGTRLSHLE